MGEVRDKVFKDLDIDTNALDFECMDQPKRFFDWAEQLAVAIQERDDTKKALSITKSHIELCVRQVPSDYGLEKVTEGSVLMAVTNNAEVKEAEDNVIKAQYKVNILSAAKEAFQQRKSMLEELVSLYISGYFSEPRPSTKAMIDLADKGTNVHKKILKNRMKGSENDV